MMERLGSGRLLLRGFPRAFRELGNTRHWWLILLVPILTWAQPEGRQREFSPEERAYLAEMKVIHQDWAPMVIAARPGRNALVAAQVLTEGGKIAAREDRI